METDKVHTAASPLRLRDSRLMGEDEEGTLAALTVHRWKASAKPTSRSDLSWRTTSRNGWCRQRAANVSYWLDSEVAVSLINVRCYPSFGHSVADFR